MKITKRDLRQIIKEVISDQIYEVEGAPPEEAEEDAGIAAGSELHKAFLDRGQLFAKMGPHERAFVQSVIDIIDALGGKPGDQYSQKFDTLTQYLRDEVAKLTK